MVYRGSSEIKCPVNIAVSRLKITQNLTNRVNKSKREIKAHFLKQPCHYLASSTL